MESKSQDRDFKDGSSSIKDSSTQNFSKRRILKNMFVISVEVLLLFTAYEGLSMLQSTMNREEGIGVTSQAIVYACFCISAILLPKYVIKKIGTKATLVLSTLTYIPYIALNFYPHWILVIPASIFIGLGAPLFWGAQAIYLNNISVMYADIIYKNENENGTENNIALQSSETSKCNSIGTFVRQNSTSAPHANLSVQKKLYTANLTKNHHQNNDNKNHNNIDNDEMNSYFHDNEKDNKRNSEQLATSRFCDRRKLIEFTTARFFGIHGMAYLSSYIWSNLMTYYVLKSEIAGGHMSNSSCMCGAKYCNIDSECFEQNLEGPSARIRYMLTATCICIGVISALLTIFFLDPLEPEKEDVSFSINLLMATYKLAKRKKLVLLIPFSFYIGMAKGFYTGDFTKSFIGCAWGTYHVGLVSVCYGAFCGMSAPLAGLLVKRMGRIPIFCMTSVVSIAVFIFLLFWKPSAEEPALFFVVAGLWGIFVGAIWAQLRAFYGILFKADEEAAFAAFHVWYSLGFVWSFAFSNHFCTSVKIYVLILICTIGFFNYLVVEILHLKDKNKSIIS